MADSLLGKIERASYRLEVRVMAFPPDESKGKPQRDVYYLTKTYHDGRIGPQSFGCSPADLQDLRDLLNGIDTTAIREQPA